MFNFHQDFWFKLTNGFENNFILNLLFYVREKVTLPITSRMIGFLHFHLTVHYPVFSLLQIEFSSFILIFILQRLYK